jgi:aspartate 1-decarboxylase
MAFVLKSEIQHILVTAVYPFGEDFLQLDEAILEAAKILENEKVLICNQANGARIETHAIKALKGTGSCCISGPATRFVNSGDHVNIMTFAKCRAGQTLTDCPVIIVPAENLHPQNII